MAKRKPAAPAPAPAKRSPGKDPGIPGKIDWTAVRDEYVTGDETFERIAARYSVSRKTVEDHARRKSRDNVGKAQGKSWGELRAEFRAGASVKRTEKAADSIAETHRRWIEKAAQVGLKALHKIDARLDSEGIKDADVIQAAKLLSVVKLEISGPDGAPIALDVSGGEVGRAIRRDPEALSAYHAVLGRVSAGADVPGGLRSGDDGGKRSPVDSGAVPSGDRPRARRRRAGAT